MLIPIFLSNNFLSNNFLSMALSSKIIQNRGNVQNEIKFNKVLQKA